MKKKYDNKEPNLFVKTTVHVSINREMVKRLLAEGQVTNRFDNVVRLSDWKDDQ